MSISGSIRLISIFATCIFLSLSGSAFADADRCAADLQKEYGKYYACALKAQSRATQKGEGTDLRRWQGGVGEEGLSVYPKIWTRLCGREPPRYRGCRRPMRTGYH